MIQSNETSDLEIIQAINFPAVLEIMRKGEIDLVIISLDQMTTQEERMVKFIASYYPNLRIIIRVAGENPCTLHTSESEKNDGNSADASINKKLDIN